MSQTKKRGGTNQQHREHRRTRQQAQERWRRVDRQTDRPTNQHGTNDWTEIEPQLTGG